MKKIIQLVTVALFLTLLSCEKEAKSIVDCLGENLLFTLAHETAAEDSKKVNFSVTYFGTDHTFDNSVNWDFGDGTVQTIPGNTATHTYTATGSYQVKAKVSLNNGACSFDIKKTVNVD